jgi:hypothetical protein
MNAQYELLFRALGLADPLIDCAMGRITLPIASMASPPDWFSFPPALCPVWSDASLPFYLGYWKHWFSARSGSFVAMYVGSGRNVTEVARTTEQFFCHVLITAICVHDGVTPEIEQFASAIGISNLSEIDSVSLKTGDDPRGYSAISQFLTDVPFATVGEAGNYTGEFPDGKFSEGNRWWESACAFEVSDYVLAAWPQGISRPPWFSASNKVALFDAFLMRGEYSKAWLTLNSPGWSIRNVKKALDRLVLVVDDSRFSLLANAWASVAEDSSGGY